MQFIKAGNRVGHYHSFLCRFSVDLITVALQQVLKSDRASLPTDLKISLAVLRSLHFHIKCNFNTFESTSLFYKADGTLIGIE